MGRGKIEIKKIENLTNRQVTFSKRRGGLLKKAHELGVLCGVDLGLIIFSGSGKMFHYSSPSSSMEEIIERYKRITSNTYTASEPSHEQAIVMCEMTRVKRESETLYNRMMWLRGENLSDLYLNDLYQLEGQLEMSLNRVREKRHLLQQHLENLHREEHLPEDHHPKQLNYLIHENHMVLIDPSLPPPLPPPPPPRAVEMATLDHFGLYSGEPKDTVDFLDLRVQPCQPNLQEPSLDLGHGLQFIW